MKGKHGQVIFYTLMLAVVIVILALEFAPVLKQFSDDARSANTNDSVGLDCQNTSISDYDKANCVAVDMFQPYFVAMLIGIAGIIVGAKLVMGG